MSADELSNQFDVLFNNITSNQAPGVTEYEKSVFLTKAQNEIVKNYFTAGSKGNNIGEGFDDSAKRQADFSCLMKTSSCTPVYSSRMAMCENLEHTETTRVDAYSLSFSPIDQYVPSVDLYDLTVSHRYEIQYAGNRKVISTDKGVSVVAGFPYNGGYLTVLAYVETGRIDTRSTLFTFPSDVFIVINEAILTSSNKNLQVVPLRYDEYLRLMSKPYKRPLKWQAWRLLNTGEVNGSSSTKYAEIVIGPNDTVSDYNIRYIRFPKPIIVGPLDGLTIDGYAYPGDGGNEWKGCELDPIIHEDILQRAVELAKVSWTASGNDNAQLVLQSGQRSE